MLISDIIRIGQPIMGSKMPLSERIQLLTDVAKEETKNFYGNIFIIELKNDQAKLHFKVFQDETNGPADPKKAVVAPITLPSGNPIHAQGIYPIASYPLYERQINEFPNEKKTLKLVYDRLLRTIPYMSLTQEEMEKKADLIANALIKDGVKYITEEKQLGVLYVIDHSLEFFSVKPEAEHFPINLSDDENVYVDGEKIIDNIIEARFEEAKELGMATDSISTVSNEKSKELVSAYNKGWLWLSHTWDLPASIYWDKEDWIKGIRLNREEYEAFVYGAQFLKQVQTPVRGAVLKEMFAPTFSAEAKQHMGPTSFETIYGIPYFLPLTEDNPVEMYTRFKNFETLTDVNDMHPNDLQLEIIGGLERRIIRDLKDDYRITIVYYSGNLARGDIHIRSQIVDAVPSIVGKVQRIVESLDRTIYSEIADVLDITDKQQEYAKFKVKYLPTMLSNAYGPGYLWSTMEKVLHGRPIQLERVRKQVIRRITELANNENIFGIRLELLFYHVFVAFYNEYYQKILNRKKGGVNLRELQRLMERYQQGFLTIDDFDSVKNIGFISGCLVQQFGRSYYAKVGKDYLKTRIMRFGGKLNPEIIWKDGLVKMEELRKRRDLGIGLNYEKALAICLPALLELEKNNQIVKDKDEFMSMFWSGYLMLPRSKKEVLANEDQ